MWRFEVTADPADYEKGASAERLGDVATLATTGMNDGFQSADLNFHATVAENRITINGTSIPGVEATKTPSVLQGLMSRYKGFVFTHVK